MPNTLITPSWVTKDVAVNFKNNLKLIGRFDRSWEKQNWGDKPQGAQIGDTVQVRIQQRWPVVEGQGLVQQAILNQTVPLTINHQFQIGMGWSSSQSALEVEMVQDRYTKPAGRRQANKWDVVAGAEVYKAVYFSAGTPGTPITDNKTITDAVALLHNNAVPDGDLNAVIDPLTQSALLSTNFALFNPPGRISEYYKTGQFSGFALGADEWYYDPNIPIHTTGTFTTATPITTSAGQTGSSLAVSGMGTYALKQGDVFTIDGVYGVNPESYTSTGVLQQFVLTADVSGVTTGTLSISPSIIPSGSLQTVTAAPGASAALTFMGATGTVAATMAAQQSRQSLLFHPAAFAFAMVDLPDNLAGANAKTVGDKDTKIAIRWVEQYNIQTDQSPSRCDTLGGVAAILPYYAVRLWT
jgi:P22 coat protein - gene protein 5